MNQQHPSAGPEGTTAIPRPRAGTQSGGTGLVPGVELGEVIGHGGYATVYVARQVAVDRPVAVKIDSRPLSDERNRRRFLREATAASRISGHPHVVSLIDAGVTPDGRPYLVMEWCPHGSLKTVLRRTGPMAPAEVRDLGLALSSALAAAHEAGILHRDIKPGNVLIDAYGAPRLSDFGLAALPQQGQELSVTLEALTPAFAAPEAFTNAEPTAASDVWSMGATLHAMLTTASPRRSSDGSPASIEHVIAHLSDPLPDPGLPGAEELMEVIRTATHYDPAMRYPTGRELYQALKDTAVVSRPASPDGLRLIGGPEAAFTALPTPTQPPAATPRRGWGVATWLAVAASLAVGAGVGFAGDRYLTSRDDGSTTAARTVVGGPGATTSATGDGAGSDGPTQPAGDTSPTTPTRTSTEAPELGVCWKGINTSGNEVTAASTSCDSWHYWETFASGVLTTATTPYLDQVQADPEVRDLCTKAELRRYVGGSAKGFEIAVIPPSDVGWGSGDRGFSCVASHRHDGEVTGSIRLG
ncbi:MAG: serine/threonine-protein kinase [Nocardioidaceae bacterium]